MLHSKHSHANFQEQGHLQNNNFNHCSIRKIGCIHMVNQNMVMSF